MGSFSSTPQCCWHGTHVSATGSDTGSHHREKQNVAYSEAMRLGTSGGFISCPVVMAECRAELGWALGIGHNGYLSCAGHGWDIPHLCPPYAQSCWGP